MINKIAKQKGDYGINCIAIDNKRTIACDGHRLLAVDLKEKDIIKGETCLISQTNSLNASKWFYKNDEVEVKLNGKVTLESGITGKMELPKIDQSFPDYTKVYQKKPGIKVVTFNAKLMLDILDFAVKSNKGNPTVKLVLHDNNEVMLITGTTDTYQNWTALVMPTEMKVKGTK